MTQNIIKYQGITLEQAYEMVEEIVGGRIGWDVDTSLEDSISVKLHEFTNLFQQSELYQVMMNGGMYEEKYEYADECYLEAYINILFEDDCIEIISWHELHHYGSGIDSMTFDVDSDVMFYIVEEILKLKNFEKVGK